jgi:putative SOS response-associated peptidase YedK
MCGRYTLTIDKSTIEKRFGARLYIVKASPDYESTYDAAPSQMLETGQEGLEQLEPARLKYTLSN